MSTSRNAEFSRTCTIVISKVFSDMEFDNDLQSKIDATAMEEGIDWGCMPWMQRYALIKNLKLTN